MSAHPQSTSRLLAPAALVVFAIVFLIVVVASLGGDGDTTDSDRASSTTSQQDGGRDRAQRRARRRARTPSPNARFYTVRAGDNLALIASRTGISLEELRTLNPTLDPQALVTGQRVRLRASAGATGATGATGAQGAASGE